MKIINYSNISTIYFCGDIHGDFKKFFNVVKRTMINGYKEEISSLEEAYEKRKQENQNHIENHNQIQPHPFMKLAANMPKFTIDNAIVFVLGDCGFGFNRFNYYRALFEKNNEIFKEHNIHIFFIRGNHDDPSYFSEEKIDFSNIKTLPDFTIVNTEKHNFLCFGGALSIDREIIKEQEKEINRYIRDENKHKKLYWEDEMIKLDDETKDYIKSNNFDIILSHAAPSFLNDVFSRNINFKEFDKSVKSDLKKQNQVLDEIYNISKEKIQGWFCGHYHQRYSINHDDKVFAVMADNFSLSNLINYIRNTKNIKKPIFPNVFYEMENVTLHLDEAENVGNDMRVDNDVERDDIEAHEVEDRPLNRLEGEEEEDRPLMPPNGNIMYMDFQF